MMHPRWMLGPKWHKNLAAPSVLAQRVAKKLALAFDFPPIQKTPYVEVDTAVATKIARYYDRLSNESDDGFVRHVYAALGREVSRQFDVLRKIVKIEYYGDDYVPYRDSADMMNDVKKKRHLWVYSGGEVHPALGKKLNLMFRAVHDFFGHAAQGYSFGPRGEENAWIEHSKLFSPMARLGLTTETRGQSSWVNFGPYRHLPPSKRPYARQKAMVLPRKYLLHPEFVKAYRRWPWFL